MNRDALNCEGISQIAFDEHYRVPTAETAPRLFGELPHTSDCADQLVDAMATAYLIAVLESICIRELQPFTDAHSETVAGVRVECRHRAPVAKGARLRVSGWVEGVSGDEVTFRVQAQDEQEQVCEASIRLAILQRERIAQRITRKLEAIKRRELFLAA